MTTATIDCDFDAFVNSTASVYSKTGTNIDVGFLSTTTRRGIFRFPLTSIAAGSTINDTDWQGNESSASSADVGDVIRINQYGTSDPDTDAAATAFSNAGGTQYSTFTGLNATGSKTADLGTTADTDVQNQITSPGWFTVGLAPSTGMADPELPQIEAIENAGSDPATLTVDYTAPAAGTVRNLASTGAGT